MTAVRDNILNITLLLTQKATAYLYNTSKELAESVEKAASKKVRTSGYKRGNIMAGCWMLDVG